MVHSRKYIVLNWPEVNKLMYICQIPGKPGRDEDVLIKTLIFEFPVLVYFI